MRVPTIKDVMREQSKFVRYQSGKLWYQIIWSAEDRPYLFDFPIPVDDAGDGEFGTIEKALTLMRWIRKHIEFLNEAAGT